MKLRRRAFTLIELLVVIAIIAILAAILFPVFAQAKLAAKGSASLSNTKQINLAALMYSNDYDDEAVLMDEYSGNQAGQDPLFLGSWFGGSVAPWSWLVTPYIKSGPMFLDPLKGDDNSYQNSHAGWGINSQTVWDELFTQFGYNAALFNHQGFTSTDWNNGHFKTWLSNSMTSISRPADMVMFTECASQSDPNYGYWAYYGITNTNEIEGPYCFSGCSDLWGGEWYVNAGYGGMTENQVEGSDTGGVAWRRGGFPNGFTNTSFADGHSKAMTPGGLAVGTTWTSTSAYGSVHLTGDYKNTYHWYQY